MYEIWENVQFWGVIVAIIAVIMGVIFNLINKRYQKKQLQVTTLFKVFDLLSSEDSRQTRRFIYEERCRLLKDKKPVIYGWDFIDNIFEAESKVNFDQAIFEGEADFSGAQFEGGIDFSKAEFKEDTKFIETKLLTGEADFSNAQFQFP